MCGYEATSDAHHITAPDPEAKGGARAIASAFQQAGVDTDKIYINAHGTSTPMNDKVETLAIKKALGEERARKALISSTKSMTGHLLGAAGAVEAVASVMALSTGIISIALIVSGIKRGEETAAAIGPAGQATVKAAMFAIPLVMIVAGFFIYLKKYKIDETFYASILRDLEDRGELKPAAPAGKS